MKSKLFLKHLNGPAIGHLHSVAAPATTDTDQVVTDVLRGLRKANLTPHRSRMRLSLRRFTDQGYFADGIFSNGQGARGYFVYSPEIGIQAMDQLLFEVVDPVPFFLTSEDGIEERLFAPEILPPVLDSEGSLIFNWTESAGVSRMATRGVGGAAPAAQS